MSAVNQRADNDTNAVAEKSAPRFVSWNRVGTYMTLIVVFFLLGFVPMWLKARDNANQRDAAQREYRLSQMQNNLSAATIDARRGDYEPARQTASDFFTKLRGQTDAGDASALTQVQRDGIKPLLQQRDEIITLLARNDPAAADRLTEMYVAYRKAMNSIPPKS